MLLLRALKTQTQAEKNNGLQYYKVHTVIVTSIRLVRAIRNVAVQNHFILELDYH